MLCRKQPEHPHHMQKLEQMHSHACAFNCLDLKAGHMCYYCTVVITFQSEKKAGEEISRTSKTQFSKTNLQDQSLSATAIANLKKPPQNLRLD